jgi:hypothetical protein
MTEMSFLVAPGGNLDCAQRPEQALDVLGALA